MGSINKIVLMLNHFRPVNMAKRFHIDNAGANVVLISGSGRSGTSWLANICNYKNSFRYIFEPLNPETIEKDKKVQWCLSDDDGDNDILESALDGTISNDWVNSRNRKLFAKNRLVKEIRSNFMLRWVKKNYPKTKIVLITRSPLAVAASRKSLDLNESSSNWVWKPVLSELLKEPVLKRRLSQMQFNALARQVGKGIVLETIADWCINNLVILEDLDKEMYFHVFYERLVSDGPLVCQQLMEYIGVEYNEDIVDHLKKNSETTRMKKSISWNEVLTKSEIHEATELLNMFGVERLYNADWRPIGYE